MKLLVTRPALDAGPLADLLAAAGHTVLLEPLLTIRFRDAAALALDDATGLLFTSANGVRAFAALSDRRDIPVFAVGDRTAAVAREQGFAQVGSADGDVAALAALVIAKRRPADGPLLHVAGSEVAGDLAERLEAAGFTVRRAVLYDAEPVTELSPETRAALAAGTLDGVLLFSPRTARQFAALMRQSGLRADGLVAWCLSPAVADALDDLPRADTRVAAEPTQAALLSLIPPVRPKETVLPKAPAKKDAPPVETTDFETPAAGPPDGDAGDTRPVATPAATAKPHRRLVPVIASAVVILIAAGAIAIFRPQIKDELARIGVTRPTAAIDTAAAPAAVVEKTPEQPAPPTETASAAPSVNPGAIAPTNPPYAAVPPAAAPAAGDDTRLQAALDAVSQLQQRLSALEAKPAADPASVQAVTAGLADATTRIARLEAQLQQQATAQRTEKAMILALAELKDRLQSSGPFDGPVAVLKAAAGDDPALAPPLGTLDKFAAHGVASRAVLAEELDGLPAAINVPEAPPADADLWQRIEARAEKLVSIRRVDDGSGTRLPPGPDRSLATAAAALKAGDLAGAVEAVKGLDGHAAAAAQPWLARAEDRLAVEEATDRLTTIATQRLDAAADQGKPQ
jgi:uroporphyrinogen-III synthase